MGMGSDLVRFGPICFDGSRESAGIDLPSPPRAKCRGGFSSFLPPGTGDLLVTIRSTRNKSMFMGFLRFSARNKAWVCYGLPERFRLMFTEVVTTLRALRFLPEKRSKILPKLLSRRKPNLPSSFIPSGDRGFGRNSS